MLLGSIVYGLNLSFSSTLALLESRESHPQRPDNHLLAAPARKASLILLPIQDYSCNLLLGLSPRTYGQATNIVHLDFWLMGE